MKSLNILLILIITAVAFSAQFEIVKDVYEDTGSITAQQFGYKDHNGDYVAILKVKTDIEGLAFTSMTLDKSEYMGNGIYHVYMQPGSRMLEFMKTGFISIKHQFPRPLESNKVYVIEVKGVGEKIEEVAITVQTDPKGATIYIDDVNKGTSEQIKTSIGKHELKLEKDGYQTKIIEIDVSAGKTLFKEKLDEVQQVGIVIKSEPSGATVSINGYKFGTTPLSDFYTTGAYKLKLEKDGYVSFEEIIQISEPKFDKTYTLQKNAGGIKVTTDPEKGLDIYLDGKKTDKVSDGTIADLKPGKYKIKAQSQYYETEEKEIEVQLGKVVNLDLTTTANFGTLTIETHPKAEVYLNGNRIYELKDIRLEPQKCNIEIKMRKAEDIKESVFIDKGKSYTKTLMPQISAGTVQVAVFPDDAEIELSEAGGETYTAKGMQIFKDVPVGTYDLTIKANGYKTIKRTLTVEEGKTVKETGIKLEEESTKHINSVRNIDESNQINSFSAQSVKIQNIKELLNSDNEQIGGGLIQNLQVAPFDKSLLSFEVVYDSTRVKKIFLFNTETKNILQVESANFSGEESARRRYYPKDQGLRWHPYKNWFVFYGNGYGGRDQIYICRVIVPELINSFSLIGHRVVLSENSKEERSDVQDPVFDMTGENLFFARQLQKRDRQARYNKTYNITTIKNIFTYRENNFSIVDFHTVIDQPFNQFKPLPCPLDKDIIAYISYKNQAKRGEDYYAEYSLNILNLSNLEILRIDNLDGYQDYSFKWSTTGHHIYYLKALSLLRTPQKFIEEKINQVNLHFAEISKTGDKTSVLKQTNPKSDILLEDVETYEHSFRIINDSNILVTKYNPYASLFIVDVNLWRNMNKDYAIKIDFQKDIDTTSPILIENELYFVGISYNENKASNSIYKSRVLF